MGKKKESAGIKPSEFKKKATKAPLISKIPTQKSNDEIPADEKLRLIDQTGLLQKVKTREAEMQAQSTSTGEYIWQAIFLSIPFGFLMATFDITVKVQYSEPWYYKNMLIKCVQTAPGKQETGREQWLFNTGSSSACAFYLFDESL